LTSFVKDTGETPGLYIYDNDGNEVDFLAYSEKILNGIQTELKSGRYTEENIEGEFHLFSCRSITSEHCFFRGIDVGSDAPQYYIEKLKIGTGKLEWKYFPLAEKIEEEIKTR